MSVELIKKQLKSGQFEKIYMLYGDESYLKAYYCQKIAEKAVSVMPSFNLHRFDPDHFSVSQLEAAISNLPLMSEKKCIILQDIDPESLKADEWKEMQALLKDIPDDCVMILHFDAVRFEKSKSKWKTLLGIVQKSGLAVEIGRQAKPVLIKWLIKTAGEKGGKLPEESAQYLISTCGEDMNQLCCELDKLCAFAGDAEIGKEAIDALVAKPLDASIYDLAKSVISGKTAQSLKMIDELFYRKEEPVIILSALSGTFCDLYRAKTAMISGKRQFDIEADFNYKGREFRIRNAMRDCAGIDISVLRAGIDLLMRADENLKSTRLDKRTILERLVVDIAGLKRRVGKH